MKIDFKSLLLGAGIAMALLVIYGQTNTRDEPVGKYQVVMPNSGTAFTSPILFDTQTGVSYSYGYPGVGWYQINMPVDRVRALVESLTAYKKGQTSREQLKLFLHNLAPTISLDSLEKLLPPEKQR